MVDWDAKWAAAGDAPDARLYGGGPNDYLAEVWARMAFPAAARAGRALRALCLADGDGRNGAWLAAQGAEVVAVDLSRVATERAIGFDAAAGVQVARIVADLASWRPGPGQRFDLVALFYLHCPDEVRGPALDAALRALEPGGWCVVEGFARAQASGRMGPDNPELLYDAAALAARAEAAGLEVQAALEGRVRLSEGRGHVGEAQVVRLLARRWDGEADGASV